MEKGMNTSVECIERTTLMNILFLEVLKIILCLQ
jgi:hypothetical protein